MDGCYKPQGWTRAFNGYLEDYTFLADGLLALYEASFDGHWFSEARRLMDEAITLFADDQNGGFSILVATTKRRLVVPRILWIMPLLPATVLQPRFFYGWRPLPARKITGSGVHDYRCPRPRSWQSIHMHSVHALGALDFHISPVKEACHYGNPQRLYICALVEPTIIRPMPNSVRLARPRVTMPEAIQAILLLIDLLVKSSEAMPDVRRQLLLAGGWHNMPEDLEQVLNQKK